MNALTRILLTAIMFTSLWLVGFVSSTVEAADPRLDSAVDFLVKAKVLIDAAEDPGARKQFDGHDAKAINQIDKALKEIALAKQAADSN